MTGHSGPVLGLAFSSDHSYLASCSWGGELNIWNPSTNWHMNSLNNYGDCFALIQLPNSQLAVGSNNNINIWSPLTTEDGPTRTLTGHSKFITSLAISPDNSILASGSWDRNVMLWNFTSKSTAFMTLAGHGGSVRSVCFVSKQILASGMENGKIKIWNVTSGKRNYYNFILIQNFYSKILWLLKITQLMKNKIISYAH